jgi:hypothetical protein
MVDTSSLGEMLSATLGAGCYYLAVLSHGGYGDIGQYTLAGTIGVPVPEPASAATLAALAFLLPRRR